MLSVIKALGSIYIYIYIFFKGGHPVCCYFLGRTPIWFFFFIICPKRRRGDLNPGSHKGDH